MIGLWQKKKRVPGMEFVGKRSSLDYVNDVDFQDFAKRALGVEFVGK